jgi:hypothetical protein
LLKKFEISTGSNWEPVKIEIIEDVFSQLFENVLGATITSDMKITGLYDESSDIPGVDYVVLPLYSVRSGTKEVPAKSGLNQWNAAGRARKFGEAYIPVPIDIHKNCKDFFPLGEKFKLYLPNTKEPADASLCQSDYKALMTKPNDELCKWIFKVIDPKFSLSMYNKAPSRTPFAYSDLEAAGFDAVRVSKLRNQDKSGFEIQFEPIGAYEDFLESIGVSK